MRHSPLLIAAALALPFGAYALSIDDLSPGKTVSGPDLAVKDMKGKVTYVIYWGTR